MRQSFLKWGAEHVDVLGQRTECLQLRVGQRAVLQGAQRQGVLGDRCFSWW